MSGLMHMNGMLAMLLICAVLLAEESGVPMPLLPGDLLLVAGGIMAATGHLSLPLFIGATTLAMCAGGMIGHAWSGAVGRPALGRLAARLGQRERFDRILARLEVSGWVGVMVCRLLPGMRVYTNLAAGIASVRRSSFAAGLVTSVLAWTVGFSLLGFLVGRPAERAIHRMQGAMPSLLLASVFALVILAALLHVPGRHGRVHPRGGRLRVACAGLVDLAVGSAVVAFVLEAVEQLPRQGGPASLLRDCAIGGAVILAYVAVSRRAAGATAGEGLLRVSYRRT
ncbi:MAG TPA: VTT domain-containing protein [Candidatus Dormibacteraeota bacterium]